VAFCPAVKNQNDPFSPKSTAYEYDVFGRRVEATLDADGAGPASPIVARWVYDATDLLLVFDGAGGLYHRYLHGPGIDQILADEQYATPSQQPSSPGTVLWAIADNLGTVRDVVDSTGAVLNHLTFTAFGAVVSETNPNVEFAFGFTGRERDESTGQSFHRARYYDPTVGRWLSEDPIGFAAGDTNLSRYVGNGATNFIDPSGLDDLKVIIDRQTRVEYPWYWPIGVTIDTPDGSAMARLVLPSGAKVFLGRTTTFGQKWSIILLDRDLGGYHIWSDELEMAIRVLSKMLEGSHLSLDEFSPDEQYQIIRRFIDLQRGGYLKHLCGEDKLAIVASWLRAHPDAKYGPPPIPPSFHAPEDDWTAFKNEHTANSKQTEVITITINRPLLQAVYDIVTVVFLGPGAGTSNQPLQSPDELENSDLPKMRLKNHPDPITEHIRESTNRKGEQGDAAAAAGRASINAANEALNGLDSVVFRAWREGDQYYFMFLYDNKHGRMLPFGSHADAEMGQIVGREVGADIILQGWLGVKPCFEESRPSR
jgi:RHS repeat-associated protein